MDAVILFSGSDLAQMRLAGVPAVARAVREAALAGFRHATICTPDPWQPGGAVIREIKRLAPALPVAFAAQAEALARRPWQSMLISGEHLLPAESLRRAVAGDQVAGTATSDSGIVRLHEGAALGTPGLAARQIVRATGKPADGIVSRHLNRPISQAISRQLLKLEWIRPGHATAGTGLIALAMIVCMISQQPWGLPVGVLLFQAASIFDGVDGEIARATFRTSAAGARLDSLVDAATNLAFVGGVALNLHWQGDTPAAVAGGMGLALLFAGLLLIARASTSASSGLNFDGVKHLVAINQSRMARWLIWLTMRDFYALAGTILVISGFARLAVYTFAAVVCGWLAVTMALLQRQPA